MNQPRAHGWRACAPSWKNRYMEPDDDIKQLNQHVQHLLRTIPKGVFGDLYRALLRSWDLQAATGQYDEKMSARPLMIFRNVHEDFVAILKTANLGDLVEKLHDALAQQKDPFRTLPSDATRLLAVCQLPELVGKVRFLDERDGEWRALTGMRRVPSDALGQEGDYVLLSGPYERKLDAYGIVAILPLHELQEMR